VEEGGFVKRLIEEDFPIFEVSRESAREKSIRHGHISTLHIWWARRPLAACRAAIFASLVPDPATLIEPIPEYVDFLLETLPESPTEEKNEWPNMRARKRLVKFTADISPWEASNNQHLLKKARKIIEVGTAIINGLRGKELTKVIEGKRKVEMPKVLDPFAGGGSIPLEALRLGCEAHALEYNPVAVLILKATLEYPQKYGEKLVKDVEKWGRWVLDEAKGEIGKFYPEEGDSGQRDLLKRDKKAGWVPIGYIWARTMQCQNPACGAEIPLMRQFWLRRKEDSDGRIDWSGSIYLHPVIDKKKHVDFEIINAKQLAGFDPSKGTRPTSRARTSFVCPICGVTYKQRDIQKTANDRGIGHRLIAVVLHRPGERGKKYRLSTGNDLAVFAKAKKRLQEWLRKWDGEWSLVPDEPLPYLRSIFNVHVYGVRSWSELFNPRQLLCLRTFVAKLKASHAKMLKEGYDSEYAKTVATYTAFCLDRLTDYNSSLCVWAVSGEFVAHTFGRQALGMVWDYFELNPFSQSTGDWTSAQDWITRALEHCNNVSLKSVVRQGSAASLPYEDASFVAAVTDPPYYDNVPYADLSDFFYVWLKRSLSDLFPDLFATPLTPKSEEIVQLAERNPKAYGFKTKEFYQHMMEEAFKEIERVLNVDGIATIVFAHKTTAAWETLVAALLRAGLVPTSSWPIHTEMKARLRAKESAALASSFFLACRRREGNEAAYFKDIKHQLTKRIVERLDHFWKQGIRGADFFISAIGPAVEVFGRYEKVKKLSGEEVSISVLLDEVRKQVTEYALSKILHGVSLEKIDPLSRFYVLWRWTYNGETVPYDDARKLAQAVGIELDDIRGKGKLISGKDKIAVAKPDERNPDEVAKRQPMSLIDALHKSCLLWKADKRKQLEKFLAESGFADDPTFWETSQALSELLPDGDKEKQMIQGLLMKAPTISKEAGKQLTLDEEWLS